MLLHATVNSRLIEFLTLVTHSGGNSSSFPLALPSSEPLSLRSESEPTPSICKPSLAPSSPQSVTSRESSSRRAMRQTKSNDTYKPKVRDNAKISQLDHAEFDMTSASTWPCL